MWALLILFSFQAVSSLRFVDTPVGCVSYPFIPVSLCSGRGVCIDSNNSLVTKPDVPGTQCVCDEGWTGHVDFVNMHTHDCGQKKDVIRAFWGFIVVFSFLEFCMVLYKLFQCIHRLIERLQDPAHGSRHSKSSTTMNDKVPKQEEKKTTSDNGYLYRDFFSWKATTISIYGLVHSISLLIVAFLRVIEYDTQIIGWAYAPTILYMFQEQSFWLSARTNSLSWLKVRGALCRFSADDEKSVQWAVNFSTKSIYFLWIPDMIRTFSVFCILFFPQQAQLLTFIYFGTLSFSLAVSAFVFYISGKKVEAVLLNGFDSLSGKPKKDRARALKGLKAVLQETYIGGFVTVPFLSLMAYWPWVRSNMGYGQWQLLFPCLSQATMVWMVHPPTNDIGGSHTGSDDSKVLLATPTPTGKGLGGGGGGGDVELEETPQKHHLPD